jgi:hypothetical protein
MLEDDKKKTGNQAVSYNTGLAQRPQVNLSSNFDSVKAKPIEGGLAQPTELAPTRTTQLDVPKMKDGAKFNAAGGGVAALNEAPSIIENFSSKPTSGKEATGKVLSATASGAQIGLAAGGPWGALIGAGVGATAGLIANRGWREDLDEENNEKALAKQDFDEQERKNLYYLNNSRESIESQKKLYLESQGYTS